MTKFKVGNRVRILDRESLIGDGLEKGMTGKVYKVVSFHEQEENKVKYIKVSNNNSETFPIYNFEYKYFETKTGATCTNKITSIYNNSWNRTTDIVDVYELIESNLLLVLVNQQRTGMLDYKARNPREASTHYTHFLHQDAMNAS